MFRVIRSPIAPIWIPVNYGSGGASTLYVGEIVVAGFNSSMQGAYPYTVAGLGDITSDHGIFGVVVGTNNRTPKFSSTYNSEYITAVGSQADQLAREWVGQEGMWGKGDPCAMVQVVKITPETVLEGDIYVSATVPGTAPTVVTNTVASTDGSTITTAAMTYATIAYNSIWYCRTGANMGLYRISYSASTTSNTFYVTWPNDIAVGDTFVTVPLTIGQSKAMFNTTPAGMWINPIAGGDSYGTDYIWLEILDVDLAVAGREKARFMINPYTFCAKRA